MTGTGMGLCNEPIIGKRFITSESYLRSKCLIIVFFGRLYFVRRRY